MAVASLFWGKGSLNLKRSQLTVPLVIYLINFAFGAAITVTQLDSRYLIPTLMSTVLGVVPAIGLWLMTRSTNPESSLPTSLTQSVSSTVAVGISQK
jgi:putative membrane protein